MNWFVATVAEYRIEMLALDAVCDILWIHRFICDVSTKKSSNQFRIYGFDAIQKGFQNIYLKLRTQTQIHGRCDSIEKLMEISLKMRKENETQRRKKIVRDSLELWTL